jgi:ankyrin repeat protein
MAYSRAGLRQSEAENPLWVALMTHQPLEAIRPIVEANPQLLRVRNAHGHLPLHGAVCQRHDAACECRRLPLVRFLLEQWPESVQEKSGDGCLALHLVLKCSRDKLCFDKVEDVFETARFLVDRFPLSVWEPTNEGYLPVHVAAIHGSGFGEQELAFLRYLVRLAPTSVRVASNMFHFPFHYAISANSACSVRTGRFLLEQWPDAVRYRNPDGSNELHMAIGRDFLDMRVVRFLIERRPQLLQETDRNGSAPLHAALALHQSPEGSKDRSTRLHRLRNLVRYLVRRRPESLAEVDHRGLLPLHVAAEREVPAQDVVRLLVKMRPESVNAKDNHGCLPLHAAVACGQPTFALVKFLVRQSPRSVEQKNADGMLPLFLAAASDAPLDVLFLLGTTWPESICGRSCSRPTQPSRPSKR